MKLDPEPQGHTIPHHLSPLAEVFTCSTCGEPCFAELDEYGAWRNPDEPGAMLFQEPRDGKAAERVDFCSRECTQIFLWKQGQQAS